MAVNLSFCFVLFPAQLDPVLEPFTLVLAYRMLREGSFYIYSLLID